jgi:hypothetical protein
VDGTHDAAAGVLTRATTAISSAQAAGSPRGTSCRIVLASSSSVTSPVTVFAASWASCLAAVWRTEVVEPVSRRTRSRSKLTGMSARPKDGCGKHGRHTAKSWCGRRSGRTGRGRLDWQGVRGRRRTRWRPEPLPFVQACHGTRGDSHDVRTASIFRPRSQPGSGSCLLPRPSGHGPKRPRRGPVRGLLGAKT